jgi:hypothetical protein
MPQPWFDSLSRMTVSPVARRARRRRAETSVRWASHMSANQLWKCAHVLQAIATLARTMEQQAALDARAERLEGLACDRALCHQVDRPDLP